jgi:hypothetical protein
VVQWITGLFFAYVIIGFFILPPIVRAIATKQLSQQLNREVSIRKVRINPLALSTTVLDLKIKDKDGETFVSWDEVYVNFQLISFFGRAWVFKEISTSNPFVRAQMNKDHSFNFSDLITKFSTNSPSETPSKPSKPLALRVDHFKIAGATASLTDLTPRRPFRRVLGPLNVSLSGFRTDPSNRNPYAFSGTTDVGESFSWSGYFYLDPIRSEGDLVLENINLNKYAPLYEDFVNFDIKDGIADVYSTYHFEFNASNQVASVTNTSFRLRSFKLVERDDGSSIADLPEFTVTSVSADAIHHNAEIKSITMSDGQLNIRRAKNNAINVVEISKPVETATNAPGGILVLLRSVTNAVAMLLSSTNTWAATIHDVNVTNCALSLEDSVNMRPVRLELSDIALRAKHISNVPGTNLTAALSLRWNTNGAFRSEIEASFDPPTADVHIQLDQLELRALDPYLESQVNLFVLSSKLGMDGRVKMRTRASELPEVTFGGDVWLDEFATADGVLGEDLLKWKSVRISGIEANLNPPVVAVREVAVDEPYARVVVETNGTVNLLAALKPATAGSSADGGPQPGTPPSSPPATSAQPRTSTSESNSAASLPRISVASVVITNAEAKFTDRSLKPAVNMTIQKVGGTLAGLSSEELQHAELNLHGSVDNVGPVEISGTINPFRENMTNDLKVSVHNVDLTPISPYVGKYAGYRLAKGKLNMDLNYHLYERKLHAQNTIVFDDFTFGEKVESPDATKLPVRMAVAVLKDRNGKIELNVPIEGNLDDPEFKLRGVILHAIVNMITKIATSPFAILGAAFGGGGEELSYEEFTPGSAELLPESRKKLDSLVKAFYERPSLQVDIEGSVNPETDLEGLRRVALDNQLRTRKWMSMRKSDRATIAADQVKLEPDERLSLLRRAYSEALAKGEISLKNPSPTPNAASTNVTGTTQSSTVQGVISGVATPSSAPEKGATALVNRDTQLLLQRAAGSGGAGSQAKRSVEDVMEELLMGAIPVSDSDFQALAAARAKAVREYILQGGNVEAERVFLVENSSGSVKSEGSRAYLQLK